MSNFNDFDQKTVSQYLFHMNSKTVKSGTMIFDFGNESSEIFIVLHGKVDVLIPSNSVIEVDEDKIF